MDGRQPFNRFGPNEDTCGTPPPAVYLRYFFGEASFPRRQYITSVDARLISAAQMANDTSEHTERLLRIMNIQMNPKKDD